MKNYVESIRKSIENENWYSALAMSLIMPDICSKLDFPEKYSSERYPEWFNTYSSIDYRNHLSGKDCYALRCSLIHEGQTDIELQSAREKINYFSFTPKGSHLISMSNNNFGSTDDGKHIILMSVYQFSIDMTKFCENWLVIAENNNEIKSRMDVQLQIKDNHSFYGGGIRIS